MPAAREPNWVDQYPRWAELIFFLIPVVVMVGALQQRHAFAHPSRDIAFAAIALSPFVIEGFNRRLPDFVAGALAIGGVMAMIANPSTIDLAPFLLVFLAGKEGAEAPLRVGLPIALAAGATPLVLALFGRFEGGSPWTAGAILAWLAGFAYQSQQRVLEELKAAQADLAATAATAERQRIAREVHDVIAHSLAVTLLHVTGARLLVTSDPDEAVAALTEAERLGRQSLAEIRQTVGLLRTGDAGGALGPMPGASDIPELVSQFTGAGLAVELAVSGDLDAIPAAMGLGLYRVVQESLANVVKHAGAAVARVAVDVTANAVVLDVSNAGGRAANGALGKGLGIPGMHERAAALGGECTAGPTQDGWTVHVRLPAVEGAT